MFKLTIKTDNAAFGDEPGYEVARILRDIAHKVEEGYTSGSVLDVNGNTVGHFDLK